jgi:hypothetical protein
MIEQTLKGELLKMSETQASVQEELLAKQNVVGVALGNKVKAGKDTGKSALLVLVNQKLAPDLLAADDKVPQKYADTPTDVIEVGDIFAGIGPLPPKEEEAATQEVAPLVLWHRRRPAMGGDSVGHYRITAGTIATCCYRKLPFPGMPPRYYILSNNHVLANSNNGNIGDPILQPGRADGGLIPSDVIAYLSAFVPIQWIPAQGPAPCNYVDAAIAWGQFHDLNREIYWIGYVKGLSVAEIGDIVRKTGRTSNFTTGRVLAVNATVDVNYGGGRKARFCRQIITTAMARGGDSGSLVCDLEERAVGLLFAGSSTITVVNHIHYVVNLLGIRIAE